MENYVNEIMNEERVAEVAEQVKEVVVDRFKEGFVAGSAATTAVLTAGYFLTKKVVKPAVAKFKANKSEKTKVNADGTIDGDAVEVEVDEDENKEENNN